MLQYKEYYMPQSKQALFSLMEGVDQPFDIIAGGTDLFAREKEPFDYPRTGIDISGIADFYEIKPRQGELAIGSNTPVQRFLDDPWLSDNVPILRHAASYFADQQIREMATLGGNLANASPSGDLIAPLLAIDATVHTLMKQETGLCQREIPMAKFIKGVGKTELLRGEVIDFVSCPVRKGYGCAFQKVGLRRSLCISVVNAAFLVKADDSGQYFEDVRIAFGGIGPVPVRLEKIEGQLKGKPISVALIQQMAKAIPGDIIQSRSRKMYRKTVVRNFLLAGLSEALAEIGITLT